MIGANQRRSGDEAGFVLVLTLIVMVAGVVLGSAGLFWATQEVKIAQNVNDKKRTFYLADAGAEYALTFMNNQLRATTFETWFTDNTNTTKAQVGGVDIYTTRAGFPAPYTLNGVTMQPVIEGPVSGPYTVTVVANDRGSISKVTATLRQFPNTAYVFDNAYFINNWGWFYGSGITTNGDVRSNGEFDTRSGPTINGHIYAAGQIRTDGSGIRGMTDFVNPKRNPGVARQPMPNLKDLSYYEEEAKKKAQIGEAAQHPSLECWNPMLNSGAGDYQKVYAVHRCGLGPDGVPDTADDFLGMDGVKDSVGGSVDDCWGPDGNQSTVADNDREGLYCDGTVHPIKLTGPVVVRGDLVIKGKIMGTGSIYSGGNVYAAGDLEYTQHTGANRPKYNDQLVDYDQVPDVAKNGNDPHGVVDGYVEQRASDPLASLSARKNVIIGDYTGTTGGSWPSGSYLYNMGKEDGVGPDGIAGTADDTTPNGVMDPGEDIDEDGVLRTTNYTFNKDVATDLSKIDNLPAGTTAFSQIATNAISTLEGIFYTNHAVAGRLGSNAVVNGVMISKDEAIYFTNTLDFNYDERIHSRYLGIAGNVDLDLPKILTIGVQEWKAE